MCVRPYYLLTFTPHPHSTIKCWPFFQDFAVFQKSVHFRVELYHPLYHCYIHRCVLLMSSELTSLDSVCYFTIATITTNNSNNNSSGSCLFCLSSLVDIHLAVCSRKMYDSTLGSTLWLHPTSLTLTHSLDDIDGLLASSSLLLPPRERRSHATLKRRKRRSTRREGKTRGTKKRRRKTHDQRDRTNVNELLGGSFFSTELRSYFEVWRRARVVVGLATTIQVRIERPTDRPAGRPADDWWQKEAVAEIADEICMNLKQPLPQRRLALPPLTSSLSPVTTTLQDSTRGINTAGRSIMCLCMDICLGVCMRVSMGGRVCRRVPVEIAGSSMNSADRSAFHSFVPATTNATTTAATNSTMQQRPFSFGFLPLHSDSQDLTDTIFCSFFCSRSTDRYTTNNGSWLSNQDRSEKEEEGGTPA